MHSVLTAAHEAAPAASRPTAPAHLGVDANPQLGSFGFCGVALYIADAMAPQAKPKEVKQLQRWLSQAHDIYQRHARAEGVMVKRGTKSQRRVLTAEQTKKLRQELTNDDDIIDLAQGLSTPLAAANAALLAAYDVEQQFGGSTIPAAVRTVVARVVQALKPAKVKPFLAELDSRLLREELRAVLAKRGDPAAARVTACVWRAASGRAREGRASGAQVGHWLGTLDDGQFILIWKVGARWQVATGPRDDVLATVPNEQMAMAVAAITPGL